MEKQEDIYETFEDALLTLSTPITPSEVHGTMCGIICTAGENEEDWMCLVLPGVDLENDASQKSIEILQNQFSVMKEALNGFDIEFNLLLPPEFGDEETENYEELFYCLGLWCQGFLRGLFSSEELPFEEFEGILQEAISDVMMVAETNYSAIEETAKDIDKAWVTIVEHVRISMFIIYGEILSLFEPEDIDDTEKAVIH